MLIISQNARLTHLNIPASAVLRVNVAWIRSRENLSEVLDHIKNDVFLDFPEGRKKPPRPVLKLDDLLGAMKACERVKYFGATDVRGAETVHALLELIPRRVQLIPKIESCAGVKNLETILEALPYHTKYIMLDKEDLYTDLDADKSPFEALVEEVRTKCSRHGAHILELAGVIFLSDMPKASPADPV